MKSSILKILATLIIIELVLQMSVFLYFRYYLIFERPKNINTDSYKIICVGESTTWGHSARGNGYPEQLEMMLNEKFPHRKFQVFNLGVSAITSSEIRKYFYKNIVDYKPHLAVILAGANGNGPRLFYISKKDGIVNKSIFYILKKLNNLKIVKLCTFALHFLDAYSNKKLSSREALSSVYLLYQLSYYPKDYMRTIDHEFNLDEIIRTANMNKVKVLLCNYFNHPINIFLREFATKRGIPFCDNEKIYKRWKAEYGTTNDIIAAGETWHPNAKGYSLIAKNLLQSIIENKLIK